MEAQIHHGANKIGKYVLGSSPKAKQIGYKYLVLDISPSWI